MGNHYLSGGVFLRWVPYLDQRPVYDAMNFQVALLHRDQRHGRGHRDQPPSGVLVTTASSDPQTVPDGSFYDPGPFTMYYTSYAGNFGTWHMGWTPRSTTAA